MLDGNVVAADVPVDFLLDLEKAIPRWRAMFAAMPTLDPSRKWEKDRPGVWKSDSPKTSQTEKVMYPVELSPATEKHPAQVKEASKGAYAREQRRGRQGRGSEKPARIRFVAPLSRHPQR